MLSVNKNNIVEKINKEYALAQVKNGKEIYTVVGLSFSEDAPDTSFDNMTFDVIKNAPGSYDIFFINSSLDTNAKYMDLIPEELKNDLLKLKQIILDPEILNLLDIEEPSINKSWNEIEL